MSPQGSNQALFQFHPYVGYNGRPGAQPWKPRTVKFNQYGLLSMQGHPYPYKKKPDKYVIAVTGGSVAEILANIAEPFLQKIAREKYGINNKIVLLSLGTGGYKQPQQLFQLQFALLSGFEFDAVLNLDGFNDLVLALENLRNNLNPLFPSGDHMGLMSELTTIPTPQTIQVLAKYYALYQREAGILRLLYTTPFHYSAFSALVGEVWMKWSQAEISQAQYRFTKSAQQDMDPTFRGPPMPSATVDTVVQIWRQASELMRATAHTYGLIYVHILQPNQYVQGSKPLTAHERIVAYKPQNPWSKTAMEYYSLLMNTGVEMRAAGVPFYDLTDVFKDNTENLYSDSCCHINSRGNEILAQHIFPILLEEVRRQNLQLKSEQAK